MTLFLQPSGTRQQENMDLFGLAQKHDRAMSRSQPSSNIKMLIYHYDETTKAYLGQSRANESPLEPGAFLIPANATDTPPPPPDPDRILVWTGQAWEHQDKPEPPPEPPEPDPPAPFADWQKFRLQSIPAYAVILEAIAPQATARSLLLTPFIQELPATGPDAIALWNELIELTDRPALITEFSAIADAIAHNNIPLRIDLQTGHLSAVEVTPPQ